MFDFSQRKPTAVAFSWLMAGLLMCCSKEVQSSPQSDQIGGTVAMMSPQFRPIALQGEYVYVANTPNNTVEVIELSSKSIHRIVPVGIEPVGLAVRPDGKELWVTNHVSDSVSIIDLDPHSPTRLQIIHTISDFDPKTKSTRFDEPVGVVFADDTKAYVSLSSENQIAVIDVQTRAITKRLKIPAQDPRGMVVRNGLLHVIAFESNNQTQLSGGKKEDIDGNLITFDAWDHSIHNNNVLSLGHVVDIVKNPKVPDRDLFIFDTKTDQLVDTVCSLGTLLYGITADSTGNIYVAQTDARNDVNGKAGTKKHGLLELDNRPFLNRITKVVWTANSASSQPAVTWLDLEPLPPEHPTFESSFATPFAIEISTDDQQLYLTTTGSDAFSIHDTQSGALIGRCQVGAVPQGLTIEYRDSKPICAWVLNAASNSVMQVDLKDPSRPEVIHSIQLKDPTDAAVKRGRIAFSTAKASTTGTFSCASCHPDGHTDQLLWVLATPIVSGGNQIMPRSTMPIRGLRDTAPFHWDGIPGDPFGGIHSASIQKSVKPNADLHNPESTTRHLIDGGLASTMARVGDSSKNDEGKAGLLNASERDDMAKFLLSVPFPPAQRRSFDNVLSDRAVRGFKLFHVEGDLDPSKPKPNVCGDCHRMPHWVSTNTPGTGMDAPTWRGAYDRWLILPQGRLNIIDFDFFKKIIDDGAPEQSVWQMSWGGRTRFNPVWDMVLEGSTGFPGAFGRQVTINRQTARSIETRQLAQSLIEAAKQETIVLDATGVRLDNQSTWDFQVKGDSQTESGLRFDADGTSQQIDLDQIIRLAVQGQLIITLTAHLGHQATALLPQPELWTSGNMQQQSGRQVFPIATGQDSVMRLSGRYFGADAWVFVDGMRVPGKIRIDQNDEVQIELHKLPKPGMHFLQVQQPHGFISNDFVFFTAQDRSAALELTEKLDQPHSEIGAIRRALGDKTKINQRISGGSTPLAQAALWGQLGLVKELLANDADVNATNSDGNTPLHLAAFMCHQEVVELLVANGAKLDTKNHRGQSPLDVVNGGWTEDLADFYRQLGVSLSLPVDTTRLQDARPKMAQWLQEVR